MSKKKKSKADTPARAGKSEADTPARAGKSEAEHFQDLVLGKRWTASAISIPIKYPMYAFGGIDTSGVAPNSTEVRVMRVDPENGSLTDVSDTLDVRNVTSEQISGFRDEGVGVPRGLDGRIDREAALELLNRIIGSGMKQNLVEERATFLTTKASAALLADIENVLKESDEILEHWKI
jgi:hypothetical protein